MADAIEVQFTQVEIDAVLKALEHSGIKDGADDHQLIRNYNSTEFIKAAFSANRMLKARSRWNAAQKSYHGTSDITKAQAAMRKVSELESQVEKYKSEVERMSHALDEIRLALREENINLFGPEHVLEEITKIALSQYED